MFKYTQKVSNFMIWNVKNSPPFISRIQARIYPHWTCLLSNLLDSTAHNKNYTTQETGITSKLQLNQIKISSPYINWLSIITKDPQPRGVIPNIAGINIHFLPQFNAEYSNAFSAYISLQWYGNAGLLPRIQLRSIQSNQIECMNAKITMASENATQ